MIVLFEETTSARTSTPLGFSRFRHNLNSFSNPSTVSEHANGWHSAGVLWKEEPIALSVISLARNNWRDEE
jgi:hypothetical protein